MSRPLRVVLFSVAILLTNSPSGRRTPGQGIIQPDQKVFNLVIGEGTKPEVVQETEESRARAASCPSHSFELGLTLGYFGLTKTLIEHPNLIYKTDAEAYYYGDVN